MGWPTKAAEIRFLTAEKKRRKIVSILSLFSTQLFLNIFALAPSLYSAQKPIKSQKNVLLITIDTLRADRLSCYSYKHLKTPNIDSLAKRGALFTRAFAHSSTTLPSHANILLGVTPPYHGVHDNFNFRVDEDFLTLAEHLKAYGYSTGAFVGAYPLDSRFGLSQGFGIYDDDYPKLSSHKFALGERKAEVVVERAINWLKTQNKPWFLFLHCFDPHDPYEPPEPYLSQYKNTLYDGEVAYVDSVLRQLFLYLEEKNLYENTLIILTGDHGESLGQHGEVTHGFFAYNTTLWVPLIILVPGMNQIQIDQFVSHKDIFPTVCDVVGVKKPSHLQGTSLLPAINGKKLPQKNIYFESLYPYYNRGWAPLKGYIQDKEKYISSPIPEFYDLEEDFEETNNLAGSIKLESYRKKLEQISKNLSYPEKKETENRFDRESFEVLKSLGYISSPQSSKKESFSPEDDIKTLLPSYNKATEAFEIFLKGETDKAVELLKDIIKEGKNVDIAYSNLAEIYKDTGRLNEALEVLKQGYGQFSSSYIIFITYVNYLNQAGHFEEVISLILSKDLPQKENDAEIWNSLGFAYWKTGDDEKALAAYEKALALDEKYVNVYTNFGAIYLSIFLKTKSQRAFQKSLQFYNKAIELAPNSASAYSGLGNAYREAGELEKAIDYWEKALLLNPDLERTLFKLSLAYLEAGNKAKALSSFRKYKSMYYPLLSKADRENLDDLIQKCTW